jgi:putative glutathione S-transferase
MIDASIVMPYPKGDDKGWPGWRFAKTDDEYPGATVDKLYGSEYLHNIYFKDDMDYKGRYSVPVLWDKKTNSIVNNESKELLRSLPNAFNSVLPEEYAKLDFYPAHLRQQIDEISVWLQSDINKGVYVAGFAPNQEAYEKAVPVVFKALNKLEQLIFTNGGPYILGTSMTELDIMAFPTLIRFDVVYHDLFKCNFGSIRHDYPVLNNWMKNLYWNHPAFKHTTDFKHIKDGVSHPFPPQQGKSDSYIMFTDDSIQYTKSMLHLNPKGITPMGPIPDIENGVQEDWSKLRLGGVDMPKGATVAEK